MYSKHSSQRLLMGFNEALLTDSVLPPTAYERVQYLEELI